jgi:hypothetical protein
VKIGTPCLQDGGLIAPPWAGPWSAPVCEWASGLTADLSGVVVEVSGTRLGHLRPTTLSRTARSAIRLNRGHPQKIFRVRLDGLKPLTTYCDRVTSIGSDGVSDGAKSPMGRFTTAGPVKSIVAFAQPN